MNGEMSFKCLNVFDSIAERRIQKPNQKSMVRPGRNRCASARAWLHSCILLLASAMVTCQTLYWEIGGKWLFINTLIDSQIQLIL